MKTNFKGKKIAILGFGLEGKDLAKYLLNEGAKVTLLDQKKGTDLDFSVIEKERIKIITGENYLKSGLLNYEIVFRSPGVYRFIQEILEAETKGVKISSATQLFFDLCPCSIIGVTGTKGKGTTSTLIYQILKESGKDIYLAGNIGKPMMELLSKLKKSSLVVLELSSFQLIDLRKSPHIVVILNITEDHMDWHKDRNEYVEAKTQIVRFQNKKDFAVLNFDYKSSKNFSKFTEADINYFSVKQRVKGSYVADGKLFLELGNEKWVVGKTKDLLLRGKHNWENVCAAVCASYLAGAMVDSIKKTVFSFKGLEHRLELVDTVDGVTFYNDSFSTNPQTTIAAIHSFEEPLTLILGGSDKGLNYDEMGREIARAQNIKNVILIGDIAGIIKKSIEKANFSSEVLMLGKMKMSEIVKKSFEITPKGGVVLLSPSTASFDMFTDYKDRGNQFKKAVWNLK